MSGGTKHKDLIQGLPPGSALDERVTMAIDTKVAVFYGSYVAKEGIYDLFLTAHRVRFVLKTDAQLLEAAITMIDDDRSLGRDEIRKRLGQMRPRHPCDF